MFRRLPGTPEWLPRSCLVGDAKRWQRGLRSGTGRQTPVDQCGSSALRRSRALVEIVIGEVVLRAGSDVEPDHLANVSRAVRKA
jgi:transposase